MKKTLPILMYHKIGLPPKESTRRGLHVSPETLDRQLACLEKCGYTFCDFEDLRKHVNGIQALPEKPVLLTFDDGHLDNYTDGLPILKKHGVKATVFIITANMGKSGLIWEGAGEKAPSAIMSWENAREMHRAGISIQSHGVTHSHRRDMTTEQLVAEVVDSRMTIEREIGVAPIAFSYPRGGYDEVFLNCVRNAGYLFACTIAAGVNDLESLKPFELTRVAVKGYRRFHIWKFRYQAGKGFRP